MLNDKARAETGAEGVYTAASRVVKFVYDRVQEAYDGDYDDATRHYAGERKSFFTADDLYRLAKEYEAGREPVVRAEKPRQAEDQAGV